MGFYLNKKALKLILIMDSLSSLPQVKSVEESPRSPVVVDKTVEVDEPSGRQLPEDYVEETRHLAHCVQAFCQYKKSTMKSLEDLKESYEMLPQAHQNMLEGPIKYIKTAEVCIQKNMDFLQTVVDDVADMFENKKYNNVSWLVNCLNKMLKLKCHALGWPIKISL